MIVLRNPLTSELHDRARSVRRVRFDWTNFVCACERERESERLREREREREALWWLSITRFAGPAWPRSSSWHPALFLLLSGVIHKENARRRERGGEGRGDGMWGETGPRAPKWGRQEEMWGRRNTNDKQKSWVNKCVSEITNREQGGGIVQDKQWQSEEMRGGPELPHYSNNQ